MLLLTKRAGIALECGMPPFNEFRAFSRRGMTMKEDDMEGTVELQATAKGLVQGVFFRKAVKKQADSVGVKGYLRNLSGGDVQIVEQGSKNEIQKFIDKIKTDPGQGRLDDLILDYRKPKETYHSFSIRH